MLRWLKRMIAVLVLCSLPLGTLSASMQGSAFPNLTASHYEVLAGATPRYNCIAWSLGITSRWVGPGKSIAAFDRLDGAYGYHRMRTPDYRVQRGVQKIVLYGKYVNGRFEATHQARQRSDGTWSSKLGDGPLIRHVKPDDLDGASYGRPVAVYFRNV